MKLEELLKLFVSYHFRLQVLDINQKEVIDENLWGNLLTRDKRKFEKYDVVGLETSIEVSDESPITHSKTIRPILVVQIVEEDKCHND